MNIDPYTGLINSCQIVDSPNYDDRPAQTDIELIVVHNISLPPGQYGGPWISALFTNTLDPTQHVYFEEIYQMQVSAHVLIPRDGQIIQFVPFHKRAWHAGKSNYCGRERCNDFSIGIELEGCDDEQFEDIQYQQLAQLIESLVKTYPTLSKKRIVGHSDIAPGRKTDPGPYFDWKKIQNLIQ
jgi:AmpD protein